MIELRWRHAKGGDVILGQPKVPIFSDMAVHGKSRFLVLQYREMILFREKETPYGPGRSYTWDEWKDVPVAEE